MVHLDEVQNFFQYVPPHTRVARAALIAYDETVVAALLISLLFQAGLMYWSVHWWQEIAIRQAQLNKKKVPTIEEVVAAEGFVPTPSQSETYRPVWRILTT